MNKSIAIFVIAIMLVSALRGHDAHEGTVSHAFQNILTLVFYG